MLKGPRGTVLTGKEWFRAAGIAVVDSDAWGALHQLMGRTKKAPPGPHLVEKVTGGVRLVRIPEDLPLDLRKIWNPPEDQVN